MNGDIGNFLLAIIGVFGIANILLMVFGAKHHEESGDERDYE